MFSTTLQGKQEQSVLEILSSLSYRTGEINTYLQEVALGVKELVDLDWVVITLCRDGLERILASTVDLGANREKIYELHGSLTGYVVEKGCPLVVEDATKTKDYGQGPEGYRAYLGVPLRTSGGKVIGTICSFQRQTRCFNDKEVRLAEVFAERAATAIDNYQLYHKQRQFNQILETEVAKRTQELEKTQAKLLEVNNHLELRVEQRTCELKQTNEQLQAEINERNETEKALRTSEERFHKIFDCSNDAIFVIDPNQDQILEANPQATKLLGYSREELLSSIQISTIHPDEMPQLLSFSQSVLEVGHGWTDELTCLTKSGNRLPAEISAAPIDFAGRQCILALVRNISDRKKAQKALERLAEIGELASMIVHEVRNPLTTVLMGLNSFKSLDLPERFQKRLGLSLDEADRLQRLLNEILLYAKPQSLKLSELTLNTFVQEIVESIRNLPVALGKQIEFIPPTSEIKVLGDKDKLKQVFINLFVNACEAITEGEKVTGRVDYKPFSKNSQICIHNGGEPISPEVLPQLTKPFFTTKSSGNGLGLAIVKRIVEAHQGELLIESNAIAGTIVTVKLPRVNKFSDSSMG